MFSDKEANAFSGWLPQEASEVGKAAFIIEENDALCKRIQNVFLIVLEDDRQHTHAVFALMLFGNIRHFRMSGDGELVTYGQSMATFLVRRTVDIFILIR